MEELLAFDALKAEVASLRHSIEGLPRALAAAGPDYAPTFAAFAKGLKEIKAHPALALTPQAFSEEFRAMADAAHQQRSRELSDAVQQLRMARASHP